jgi:murein DD-endopeptidase MepM/ murein hydrolase activator NlpD
MSFMLSAILAAVTLIAAAVPPISLPGGDADDPRFPAAPGYLLPWAGGTIESVTQGEETSFTHNGVTAYAFDFGMVYDTVVASRSGRVTMVYVGSNSGGCDPSLNIASNYVVIDHGDGTSALYLHLAYDSAQVAPGDLVERGQPLAVSGDTGMTCSDADVNAPAPHLHFQVQRTEVDRYMTQSLPIAFDDVSDNEGIPVEGEEYVSGNYGSGKPQKTPLTPRRSERIFAPVATPADPAVSEIPFAEETPPPAEWPTAAPSETPPETPSETATETPTETATPLPTDTPVPLATPTPASTETPVPAPSDTPTAEPIPSDTPTPEPAPSDTPPPAPESTP